MPWVLDKISSPGWEKAFKTKDDLVAAAYAFICDGCKEEIFSPTDLHGILMTACGCEICAYDPDGEGL